MSRYDVTFEITSEADAYAVQRLMEQTYDTFREELQHVSAYGEPLDETLERVAKIREAMRDPSPGTLTISYERHDTDFTDSRGE